MAKIETKRYATFTPDKDEPGKLKWRGDSYRTAFEAKRAAASIPGAKAKLKDGSEITEEPKRPESKVEALEDSAPFSKSVRKL